MSLNFRRIASAAALMATMMPGLGAEVLPNLRGGSTSGAFGSHKRLPRHRPAGSKLWRKHHRVGEDYGRMHNNVRGY